MASRGRPVDTAEVGLGRGDIDTALFDIGSAAKTFTAAAVLLLQERGRLAAGASIARYLAGVPKDKRSVTVAQLLEHDSGLPQDFSSDQAQLSRAAAVRHILALPMRRPGRFRYSNAGYTLLAAIVESVARTPFRTFVTTELLRPLGLVHTGWYDAPPPGATPVDGHVGGRNTGPAGTQAPASWATLGAGGMTSTAKDLATWAKALNTGRVLDKPTSRLMFTPREPLGPPGTDLGYGWVIGRTPTGAPVRLVGGDTDFGFTSDIRYYPLTGVVTVGLSCSDATPAIDIGHDLSDRIGAA